MRSLYRILLLTIIGCGLVALAMPVLANTPAEAAPIKVVTMKAPNGSFERFSSNSQDLTTDNMLKDIFALGTLPPKIESSLCKLTGDVPTGNLRQVESQLELDFIVNSLKRFEKPRKLTNVQKKTLSKIPTCQPYLMDLAIITKLMKGYDFVKVEYKHN